MDWYTERFKREYRDAQVEYDRLTQQFKERLVLQFERHHPPPWDEQCMICGGEGCEECECEECDLPCRHINGVNYGCRKHPVI